MLQTTNSKCEGCVNTPQSFTTSLAALLGPVLSEIAYHTILTANAQKLIMLRQITKQMRNNCRIETLAL